MIASGIISRWISIMVFTSLIVISVSTMTGMASAEPADSRAEGAEDVGPFPGKINYYEDGYPNRAFSIHSISLSLSIGTSPTAR